jgi:N-acetylglutamate synthase-like GNAT family acetyltransferase
VAPRLRATALAAFERDGLKAALGKSGLPADVEHGRGLFWRFETDDDVPVGFGGIEVHGRSALLCAMVTLPPLRGNGYGSAILSMLEQEVQWRGCRAIYLAAVEAEFFARRGYVPCHPDAVPNTIQSSPLFGVLTPGTETPMLKRV